jgi:alanine-glyoxylate transaminase/serine-glyoxylate transaminase/serine-pyruvate transaminase
VFRIGHLGSLNELEVLATLAGTELALLYSGQTIELGVGVAAAQRFFAGVSEAAPRQSAKPRVATPERVG